MRQIFFLESWQLSDFPLDPQDQIYQDLLAETFLAQVLCGLKSPLLGETEVFGQFKLWWKALPDTQLWKKRHQARIDLLFHLVKSVRENVLCGQGSQSYGSLLRRHLKNESAVGVEILGNGHLAQEIAPWLDRKAPFRVWCRNPEKVLSLELGKKAQAVVSYNHSSVLWPLVVVAAPLSHDELNDWLSKRGFSSEHTLFDFRSDSADFIPFVKPRAHWKLADFSSAHEVHRNEIEKKAEKAQAWIAQWQEKQESKVQVRPYGWDDL